MVDYLQQVHGVEGTDAYALASTAANLKISEVVDVPHMLVTMQLPRSIIPGHPRPNLVPGDGSGTDR
jgi:acetamidase/formamidase